MIKKERRQFDGKFKTKVVIESLRERKTMSELCKDYDLHPNQISDWKKTVLEELPHFFERGINGSKKANREEVVDIESVTAPLYQQIGQLKVELDYLKKKCSQSK